MADRDSDGEGVQLSTETEKLLGNILEDEDDTIRIPRHRQRRRHDEEEQSETQIGPPPMLQEVYLGPEPGSEEGLSETTVASAVDMPRIAALGVPLADLGIDSGDPVTTLDEDLDALTHGPGSGPARPARVFSDLQMEFDQLDTSIDSEVTQRVVREDEEKTRRSEMPPEFLEVLEREEGPLGADAEESEASPEVSPGPSSKVEIDESLGEELSRLEEAEAKPDNRPRRPLPRPSDLHVQKVVLELSRPRARPLLWAAMAALVLFLLLALWVAL